jgi:hypothetical protein
MIHNLSVLTTVAQCDDFMAENQTNLAELNFDKATLTHRLATGADTAEQLRNDLIAAESDLALFNTLLQNTPEGQRRDDLLDDINNTENDIIRLTSRLQNNGVVSQFMRSVDLDFILAKQAANQELEVQINDRKSAITLATTN